MSLWSDFKLSPLDAGKVSFIRALVGRGYSANRGLALLKKSPLGGMRRQKFLRIFKAILNSRLSEQYVQGLGRFEQIDEIMLKKSPFNHERAYNYIIHAKSRLSSTGEVVESYITISTDEKLDKNQALLRAGMYLGREKYDLEIDATSAEVENCLLGNNYYQDV